ncbi:MAG: SpoIIIAH-like family protein [Lachnospiraceae bacterium]|nr:SpoIIIAH-like family protein [Lachnospiraceae bacterium]MBD5483447.1 SpoIIIAH-like family protein [Lachnospiraceae bacterium]
MKKILRRNQVMITALAMMIVIAGYLHFAGSQVDTDDLISKDADAMETSSVSVDGFVEYDADTMEELSAADLADISDEDIELGAAGSLTDIESLDTDYAAAEDDYLNELAEVSSAGLDEEQAEMFSEEMTVDEIPGEAVYTSTTAVTSLSAARLQKEQTRARNKEIMLEIINNVNIGDEQKQAAIDSMIEAADIAERESAAEILLEAKGYQEAVVSITGDQVDVLVYGTMLTEAQCAQIEDIVKRKTGIDAANIIITPVALSQ